jgi:hypothetical protein
MLGRGGRNNDSCHAVSVPGGPPRADVADLLIVTTSKALPQSLRTLEMWWEPVVGLAQPSRVPTPKERAPLSMSQILRWWMGGRNDWCQAHVRNGTCRTALAGRVRESGAERSGRSPSIERSPTETILANQIIPTL